MLLDLILKFIITPGNVIGLIWSVIITACMCLIFHAWQEKWWKSLIPFYGKYLIYKNTWKQWKWLFLVEVIFDTVGAKCISFMKKHVVGNALYGVQDYMETGQLDIDIEVEQIICCIMLLLISMIIVFVLKRVTYVKVCGSLGVHYILLKIGTFIVPEIGLLITYMCYRRKDNVAKLD